MITEIALRYPCNHGNNFYIHAVVLTCSLLLSLINIKKNIGVISMAFIGLLLVLTVNYYNVGIDYDTWIERGMPEWGELSTCVNCKIKCDTDFFAFFIADSAAR